MIDEVQTRIKLIHQDMLELAKSIQEDVKKEKKVNYRKPGVQYKFGTIKKD